MWNGFVSLADVNETAFGRLHPTPAKSANVRQPFARHKPYRFNWACVSAPNASDCPCAMRRIGGNRTERMPERIESFVNRLDSRRHPWVLVVCASHESST